MPISNFPAALQPIIQKGFLARKFEQSLRSTLGYRDIADRENFPNKIGETITKTRRGLKAPVETYADPTANTGLDNGLTPSGWTVEQYTLTIGMVGDTIDLNTVTEGVGIAKQFVENADVNGVQAAQSVDRIARKTLFGAYLGGHTHVTATLGAPGVTVAVDDVRGFQTVFDTTLAQPVPVSVAKPLAVVITKLSDGTTATGSVTGVAVDATNVSTSKTTGGISGVLTFAANVSVVNGTIGNAIVTSVAPTVVRPNNRVSGYTLTAGDKFTMQTVRDAVTQLRNNGVPAVNGRYNCYLDPTSASQLFSDSEFQLLYRGTGDATVAYKMGQPVDILDVRFISTTEAHISPSPVAGSSLTIHRPIVCGKGALVEGDFENLANADTKVANAIVDVIDDIAMVTRGPLDRLAQIIAQSWYWIGGFAVPTDITANPTIIPTSNNAYYKRAVVIEHV